MAALVLLGLTLHGPGLLLAGYDGEEGRRVMQAFGMLRDGHWIVPHVAGEPYLTKPPLYPWLVALPASVLGGVSPWLARLPSLLATLGVALVLARQGRRLGGRRAGLLAAGLWLVAPAAAEKAALAETDAVLAFGIALATLSGPSRGGRIAAAAGMAIALMVKGPPALVLLGAALAGTALARGARAVRWRAALAVIGVGLLPLLAWSLAVVSVREVSEAGAGWLEQLTGEGGFAWRRYLEDRLDYVLGPPLAALPAALCLPGLLRRRREEPELAAPAAAALLVYLFFLVYPRAEARYAYPAVPWVALAAGVVLARRAALPPAVKVLGALALLVAVGRVVGGFVSPGARGRGPGIAATLEEHLAPGEILYDRTAHHDVLALLDHRVRHARRREDVRPGGAWLTATPGPTGWRVVAEVGDGEGWSARLVRAPGDG